MRDTVDRLTVTPQNFTLTWYPWRRYNSSNGVTATYPGDIYNHPEAAMDPFGFVHLKGLLNVVDTFASVGARLGELPPQFKPNRECYVPTIAGLTAGGYTPAMLIVRRTGAVDGGAAAGASQVAWFALDGLRFWKEGP